MPFILRIVAPLIVVIQWGNLHAGVPDAMLSMIILLVTYVDTSKHNVGWWPFIGILMSIDGLSQVLVKHNSECVTSVHL